jgi:cytoskeleton protein RodZ
MSDFGGKLRLAREHRGLTLRQIADRTKISSSSLEALERNDISKLPGGIFSRSFVRSYAVEVGLDPDQTVKEFLARFQGQPVQASPPPSPIPESETDFDSHQRIASLILKLLIIGIPLAVIVLYFTLRARPAASAPLAAPVLIEQPVGAGAAPSPSTDPATATPAAAASAAAPSASSAETMTLEVHPTAACWVKLTVDGRPVLERTMQAGEREVRKVRENAVIEAGDAGAFAFSIDGRPGKPLGTPGQLVKTTTITRATALAFVR